MDVPSYSSDLMGLRRQVGITQAQMATALGVTEQTIRNWERGRCQPTLTIPQIKALCRLLSCDLDDLPDNLGTKNSPSDDI